MSKKIILAAPGRERRDKCEESLVVNELMDEVPWAYWLERLLLEKDYQGSIPALYKYLLGY